MHTFFLLALLTAPIPPLASDFGRIADDAQGRVGVAVVVLEGGEPIGWQSGYAFPMQSVYKLPIAMAVLHEVDGGRLSIDTPVSIRKAELIPRPTYSPLRDQHPEGASLPIRELVRLAVSESDSSASDALMRVAGGPTKIMSYLQGIGVRELIVANPEMQMVKDHTLQYRNTATPDAALALLRALHSGAGLSEKSRALLLKHMTETTIGPKRLKGGLPAGTIVAHKTGTSSTDKGIAAATNDIGIVSLPDGRHMAIAVFVSDAKADQATREAVIARLARAAWDFYVSQK